MPVSFAQPGREQVESDRYNNRADEETKKSHRRKSAYRAQENY
jgi:hypothetical protein